MIIDRPHRSNGEIAGYHLAIHKDNGHMSGKYISIDEYNSLNEKTIEVEKEKVSFGNKLKEEDNKDIEIELAIAEPVKRTRNKK